MQTYLPNIKTSHITVKEFFQKCLSDLSQIDFAVPQSFQEERQNKGDTEIYVWDYRASLFGEPLGMSQLYPQLNQEGQRLLNCFLQNPSTETFRELYDICRYLTEASVDAIERKIGTQILALQVSKLHL